MSNHSIILLSQGFLKLIPKVRFHVAIFPAKHSLHNKIHMESADWKFYNMSDHSIIWLSQGSLKLIPKVRFHMAIFPVKVCPVLKNQRYFAALVYNGHDLMKSYPCERLLQLMAPPVTLHRIWCKHSNCFSAVADCLRNVFHNWYSWDKVFEVNTADEASLFKLSKEFLHPDNIFIAVADEYVPFGFVI